MNTMKLFITLFMLSKLAIAEILGILSLLIGAVTAIMQLDRKITKLGAKVNELERDVTKSLRETEGQNDLLTLLRENLAEIRAEMRSEWEHYRESLKRHERAIERHNDSVQKLLEKYELKKRE